MDKLEGYGNHQILSFLFVNLMIQNYLHYLSMEKEKIQQDTAQWDHQLAFVFDIDGTLVLSHKQIEGASEALNLLDKKNIPYILVTNNISHSEQTKADELNDLLHLNRPLQKDQIILNITPLKKHIHWEDKIVLIVIRQQEAPQRLPFEQIPLYITIEQYVTIFPEVVPLSRRKIDDYALEVIERVSKRLSIPKQNLKKELLKIGGVLVLNAPLRWQECYQVIIDLLSSEDGSLENVTEYKYIENHIPILTALNDMYMMTKNHPLPRILIKPFNEGLKSVYREIYKHELKIITYGKPERKTYEFCSNLLQNLYGKVKKIVMVGDNEDTDIKGAHNFGWESILVPTGVTKHPTGLATHSVSSLKEGLSKYGIQE